MTILDPLTGELSFPGGLRLSAGMSLGDGDRLMPMGKKEVSGGIIAPLCLTRQGLLSEVRLSVCAVDGQAVSGAAQRAFLFSCLRFKDPCPDTQECVRIRCAFGEVLVVTDPYTGSVEARIRYALDA